MHWVIRILVFPLGRKFAPPSDALSHTVARLILEPGEVRDRLTAGMYVPTDDKEPLAHLEQAMECAVACDAIEIKLRNAIKAGQLTRSNDGKVTEALERGIINQEEAALLEKMKVLRRRVIMVDDFPPDFGKATGTTS